MKPQAIAIIIALTVLASSNVYLYNEVQENREQAERNKTFLTFIGRGAELEWDWVRDYGGWVINCSIEQSSGSMGMYSLDCEHGYFTAEREWVNFTLDSDDLRILARSWEKYAYCEECGHYVRVQFYDI